jgi:phospholipid/cholesterol/gamma-HCH transport system substrate-binding protein
MSQGGKNGFAVEAKVGIFAILVLSGLIYLTTQINRSGFSFGGSKTLIVTFSDVSGLLPRTSVELSGIRVGSVDQIYLQNGKAYVVTKIDKNAAVYQDSVAALRGRGILGEKIIAIVGGGSLPPVPDGGTLEGISQSGDFDTAMRNFNEVAEAIKGFLKGEEGKPSIQQVINNMHTVSEDLKDLVQTNREGFNDIVKNVHTFSKMLNDGNLKEVVASLKSTSEMIQGFVEDADPQLRDVVHDFKGVVTKINGTVESLNRIVAKVERGEGTLGKLLSDETTVNKVNDTLDGINDFVGRVQRLELAVGYRGEFLGSTQQLQSVASFRIQPNYDKYFLLEFTDTPLATTPTMTTVTETTTDGGSPVTVVEKVQKDRFVFTALFARRFFDLTLKAGLMRSTGGLGAEFHLFKDRFSLGVDAFDFGRNENPHLRVYGAMKLWKILHLTGGVDDLIIKGGQRNYFGGVGLMLTDDDLKSLLGVAGIAASAR